MGDDSLRTKVTQKVLDTNQLSTIIEILPLHFLQVLSLSIYAT